MSSGKSVFKHTRAMRMPPNIYIITKIPIMVFFRKRKVILDKMSKMQARKKQSKRRNWQVGLKMCVTQKKKRKERKVCDSEEL